jgi:ribosome-binding factor A
VSTVSHRPEQIASLLRRRLQEALMRGLNDPRVRGLVTITDVSVSPDLSEARCGVSVLPAEHGPLTLAGLQSAAPHLARRVTDGLRLRRLPRFRFELDESLKAPVAEPPESSEANRLEHP